MLGVERDPSVLLDRWKTPPSAGGLSVPPTPSLFVRGRKRGLGPGQGVKNGSLVPTHLESNTRVPGAFKRLLALSEPGSCQCEYTGGSSQTCVEGREGRVSVFDDVDVFTLPPASPSTFLLEPDPRSSGPVMTTTTVIERTFEPVEAKGTKLKKTRSKRDWYFPSSN